MHRHDRMQPPGFTLIELLVVMAIMATLLSIVAPHYFHSVDRAHEAVLRTNLKAVREAIDKFSADTGRLPATLQELVDRRYLRELPYDPVTERSDTWQIVKPACSDAAPCPSAGVFDIRSGAAGRALDGSAYAQW